MQEIVQLDHLVSWVFNLEIETKSNLISALDMNYDDIVEPEPKSAS